MLDLPNMGFPIMLKLCATIPNRADFEVLLAEINGNFGAQSLQIDACPMPHLRQCLASAGGVPRSAIATMIPSHTSAAS